METELQSNQGMPRFGPSDCLIAMFRSAPQSHSITHTVAILCVPHARVATIMQQIVDHTHIMPNSFKNTKTAVKGFNQVHNPC